VNDGRLRVIEPFLPLFLPPRLIVWLSRLTLLTMNEDADAVHPGENIAGDHPEASDLVLLDAEGDVILTIGESEGL
jgi:hypothetical protein